MGALDKVIEQDMLRVAEIDAEINRLKVERDLKLRKIQENLFKEQRASYEMLIGEDQLLVAEYIESHPRKLAREELANDLGVLPSKLKTPFLIQCVEERRLTHEQYQRHFYTDFKAGTRVKKKKPKKPRKGRVQKNG